MHVVENVVVRQRWRKGSCWRNRTSPLYDDRTCCRYVVREAFYFFAHTLMHFFFYLLLGARNS